MVKTALALLLLVAVYSASAETFIHGTFWARGQNIIKCGDGDGVISNPSALIGLADTCLAETELNGETHSTYLNTTAGSVQISHYNTKDCSGEPVSFVEFFNECASLQEGELTLSIELSAPQFRGDQIVWANYYDSKDCSGDAYQFGSDAPSTTVLDECTGYYRMAGASMFTTITKRISEDEIQVQYFKQFDKLCRGAPSETKTYAIDECIQTEAGSAFGSLKIVTSAPKPPPFLSGRVNLNEDAANLNKQVAGASIGVLCGFTALLICISMTGILG